MAVTVDIYDSLRELMADGTIDMDDPAAGAFKVLLVTGYTFSGTHIALDTGGAASVRTKEIANGNGYTTNGVALATISWTKATVTVTFDASVDTEWDATSAGISAAGAVVYYDGQSPSTDADREVMIHINFGATESAGAGTKFKITWDASGIINLT